MLIILGLFFITLVIIPILAYNNDQNKFEIIRWGGMCSIIVSMLFILVMWESYGNYVTMKQHFINFEHHAETIEAYTELAVLDTSGAKTTTVEFTDLKYQNYQRGVKDLIEDLRNSCIEYNKILIGKELYGNNIIFSWLIIMPDDNMKVVKISDFLDTKDRP